jgi:hypothetical protein
LSRIKSARSNFRSVGLELLFHASAEHFPPPEPRPLVSCEGCEDEVNVALGRGVLSGRLSGRMRRGIFLERSR